LFRKGKDIVEVQKILGHDDISTTQKYLDVYKQLFPIKPPYQNNHSNYETK
jgi:site-specific recombinase XerD